MISSDSKDGTVNDENQGMNELTDEEGGLGLGLELVLNCLMSRSYKKE